MLYRCVFTSDNAFVQYETVTSNIAAFIFFLLIWKDERRVMSLSLILSAIFRLHYAGSESERELVIKLPASTLQAELDCEIHAVRTNGVRNESITRSFKICFWDPLRGLLQLIIMIAREANISMSSSLVRFHRPTRKRGWELFGEPI